MISFWDMVPDSWSRPPQGNRGSEGPVREGMVIRNPSRAEVELASMITKHVPSAQKVRFVNSGTEATMTALRLSRGFTGRSKILKFDGNYHGAHDYVLIDAGSAASEFGVPFSQGIPTEVSSTVLVCPTMT